MDIKTIINLLALGNLTIIFFLNQHFGKTSNETAKSHLVSQVFFTCAFLAFALIEAVPERIVITVGTACILFGGAHEVIAMLEKTSRAKPQIKKIILLASAIILIISILTGIKNMPNISIVIMMCGLAFIWMTASFILLSEKRKSKLQTGIGILFLIISLSDIAIIKKAFDFSGISDLLTPGLGQSLTFLGFFLYMILAGTGMVLLIKEQEEIRLLRAASVDDLTGIINRKQFIIDTEKSISYAHRKNIPYALIILDVDYFKLINDTYGHRKGDELLQHLTRILQNELRRYDILGRFGGDEFMIFLQDTDRENSYEIAMRLKCLVQNNPLHDIEFTISMGLVSVERNHNHLENFYDLYHESDQALYRVKNSGRNAVAQVIK